MFSHYVSTISSSCRSRTFLLTQLFTSPVIKLLEKTALCPKSFSPFLLLSPSTIYIFGDFNCHHSSWDSHSLQDQLDKNLFDWFLSSDLLPLNNPNYPTLLYHPTGNRSSPDSSLVPASMAFKCT